jgi:uncharacterized protein YecE (DUF72 family)
MGGQIYVGIGGWNFEPWRGVFYPDTLSQKRELEYASRHVTSIEINATYYGGFKPDTFRKWRDETPDGFVFSLKASRFCTNRKVLGEGADSIKKFLEQGLTELGSKLGPINWQFMATKKFDPAEFDAFLGMLPKAQDGVKLRHVVEVRSPTFCTPDFYALARKHNVAICYAKEEDFPEIDQPTGDFTYARFMSSREDLETGVSDEDLDGFAAQCRDWAKRGDVFAYFIAGAKVRNPAAAMALIEKLKS